MIRAREGAIRAQARPLARRASRWGRAPIHAGLLAIIVLWVVPVVALLVSSFRPADLVSNTGWWSAVAAPFQFTLDNYRQVLGARNLGSSFINSLTITLPVTVLSVLLGAITGYVLVRIRFRGRETLFAILLGLLVVPLQMTLVPILRLFGGLGLIGTFPAMWIAHLGYGLPFIIFVMRNYFASLPTEMFEAAEVDGAGHVTAFWRLAMATAGPALAAVTIFQFMFVWNDLLIALIYLGGTADVAPLTITVSNLVSSRGEGWQVLTAAAFVHMAVPLAIFFSLQRYFVRGLLAGSSK